MATEMKLKMVKNEYNIPAEQLEYYKKEIMELLPKYRYKADRYYKPTERGVSKLLECYNVNKGWLYPYFMNHPNYIGNGKIAFSSDYHRSINHDTCSTFISWVRAYMRDYFEKNHSVKVNGMTYVEAYRALTKLSDLYDKMCDIQSIKLGSESITVKVNGMTLNEIKKDINRFFEIIDIFDIRGHKICGNNGYYYITKEGEKQLDHLEIFLQKINMNLHSLTTPEEVSELNKLTEAFDLKIVSGQKFSKIINKLCHKLELDKRDEYNREFAKFSDGINELDIKRHTIISINPIDYLTMSFGNSWASCHTIDKMNDRNMENSYTGSWSGGTLSYMLDGVSVVFYTVDKKYDGTDFEFQPKVNRCMFHIGEDKLIQGRVYPQTNDNEDCQGLYNTIRSIMQKVVSEMFGFDNYWILKKGTSECSIVTDTRGRHYPDYIHYNTCNVSYVKPAINETKNTKIIPIGHIGICPTCGFNHRNSKAIICSDCMNDIKRCPHCRRRINGTDLIEIDGQTYCSSCAKWCDFHQRWEIDTRMYNLIADTEIYQLAGKRGKKLNCSYSTIYVCKEAIDNNPDRYKRDMETNAIVDVTRYTKGIEVDYYGISKYYANKDWAIYKGYKEAYNGKWYDKDNLYYDRHTGVKAFIPADEWNYSLNCWNGIADKVREQNEKLAQRAARREARRNAGNVA